MTKRIKKILTISLSSLGVIAIAPAIVIATVKPNLPATKHLIAHRGYSAKYFQNSYAAFENAVGKTDSKFWGAETDLQLDKSGVLWCSHYINPFIDQSQRIDELETSQIEGNKIKTIGSIDTSSLPSKAFPTGALNPYKVNVPDNSENNELCKFYDSTNEKGYLNTFLNNKAHPIIELKIESSLIGNADSKGCMTIDNDQIKKIVDTMLTDLKAANDSSSGTLLSRCYFVSFFDDLLAETINHMHDSKWDGYFDGVQPNQFQKLLDDGGVGQYILSTNEKFTNTTPGDKKGSNTTFKNYSKYIDGSWFDFQDNPYPIGLDVYYALIDSKMINTAHKNNVEVNCWTADYTRTEIAEAISLDMLAKAKIDYITTDDWYDLR